MPTSTNRKQNSGFTLAELLVVVAIIGVLVAISIPIFTGQLRKARVATNKANIRAARAAGIAKYYDDEIAGEFTVKAKNTRPRAYYYYDTASGKITGQIYYDDTNNIKHWDYSANNTENSSGAYKTASNYGVCTYIIIYVSPTDNETGAALQTAPFYTDKDDKPVKNSNGSYFGPDSGK